MIVGGGSSRPRGTFSMRTMCAVSGGHKRRRGGTLYTQKSHIVLGRKRLSPEKSHGACAGASLSSSLTSNSKPSAKPPKSMASSIVLRMSRLRASFVRVWRGSAGESDEIEKNMWRRCRANTVAAAVDSRKCRDLPVQYISGLGSMQRTRGWDS